MVTLDNLTHGWLAGVFAQAEREAERVAEQEDERAARAEDRAQQRVEKADKLERRR
jgi:hypothetical protein